MRLMKTLAWFVLLLGLGVAGRLIPHLPNFTPTLAIALFAGSVLPGPLALLVAPLSVFLSDLAIGFHDELGVVYLSLLPLVILGGRSSRGMLGVSMLASAFFFVTTNLAVWWDSGMYAHSALGLNACFVAALPFLGWSFLGTALYLGALRAVEAVAARRLERARARV